MRLHRFSALLIMGLVMILGVQLTGVSCLEDWQLPASPVTQGTVHTSGITTDLSGLEGPTDDGCPCHLAFVSVKTGTGQVISPVVLSAMTLPDGPPIPRPFTLFHPPLRA